ncbi:MAG TPA: HDOD domain-containing protein [Rhodocyclaceae bacterium]|jgi:HD-like signal output (HDOD) protein|nr:HDOD domain-containing protein [Rhodocyclaceae bacterium]
MESPTDSPLNDEFEAALRDNRIPPCPLALERISQEMRKTDPNFRQLSNLISGDVALAAGLIRLANSPYFGARRRVASVAEALLLLGLDTASQAVACIALGEAFPNMKAMERFWDASAQIANLSGWLANERQWPGVRPQEAYTYGLFRDCGIAVLLQHFPDYTKILQLANHEELRTFTDIEDEVLPTNHVVMGSMMTQSWWLPENICQAVRYHHELADSPANEHAPFRYLVAISQVAEFLLQKTTGRSVTNEWSKLGPMCLQQLELSPEELIALEPKAKEMIAQHAN